MDILKQAIDTAEALGMPLTQTTKLAYDVLGGYDYKELAQFVDNKQLEKFVKSQVKDVLTNRTEALYLKPITLKDTIYIVLGKALNDNALICCRQGDDYRVALTPSQKGITLTAESELSDDFRQYYNDVVSKVEFAQSVEHDLANYKLDRCDDKTGWEIGKAYLDLKEVVYDTQNPLAWGFNFFKVVYSLPESSSDVRVVPCLLLKESKDLNLFVRK
jgi:hypothetical protein